MIELLSRPWPWYVAGPVIGLFVPLLLLMGRRFGVSSSLSHVCAATVPRTSNYFRYDWRAQGWNLAFVAGIALGGLLAGALFPGPAEIALADDTRAALRGIGLTDLSGLAPVEIFSWERLLEPRGLIVMLAGGFLVGFGARWAGGCTSGHAISGLAELRASSLVVVVGFFAGGLFVTHWLLPRLLGG